MIELKYRQSGDYLLPDLGLTEAEAEAKIIEGFLN